MSYIPDYRKETAKLNEADRNFIAGYRAAIENAKNFFYNGDMYEATAEEEKVLADCVDPFDDFMQMEETEMVLALFESGEYEDLELEDANRALFWGTKGAE